MMMKVVTLILVCWISLQDAVVTELVMTNPRVQSEGCKIHIINTHQILDIRTNCKHGSQSKYMGEWSVLIPSNASYKMNDGGHTWEGYRYFKNPQHYKYFRYNFTQYSNLLDRIIQPQGIKLASIFSRNHHINIHFDEESSKWELTSLKIQFSGSEIEQIKTAETKMLVSRNIIDGSIRENSLASRKLQGSGLHQAVNLTIELDLATNLNLDQSCQIVIEEILPESTYVDVDQLRSVQRYQVIDIEKPEHVSQQYYYKYRISLKKFLKLSAKKYSFKYPIHFRYPEPSLLNYTTVPLHPSERIALQCSNKIATILEDPFVVRGNARIFNGSSHDVRIVSMITFILTIVASMVLVQQLRKI